MTTTPPPTAAPLDLVDFELAAYAFDLPTTHIAQFAVEPRHAARLLVADRHDRVADATMWQLPELLLENYGQPPLLVVNDTKVVAARLQGIKASGGRVQLLLESPFGRAGDALSGQAVLYKASKPLRVGQTLDLGDNCAATVRAVTGGGRALVDLSGAACLAGLLDRVGHVPLPPYIRAGVDQPLIDRPRYQCTWAEHAGAVAAPTAGLHFSAQLLEKLSEMHIECVAVTLHVGPGTFLPVRAAQLQDHRVAGERYEVSASTAQRLAKARRDGQPIVAVGTTTTRTVEHAAAVAGLEPIAAGFGSADLTILPGHRFRVIQGMVTNFHLPQSSLLVLVSAFLGRARVLRAYQHAIGHGYRFYSYGDACLLVN
ncbi:MAG: tRNA preQ1(34) S-adenosylmethionine ribosyltransferase-isomerase QueA [Myxococcales bacterium]|nr:tRNA preQ1(34) S-adenosylmethionine ribosyltransferase-isomerase QueA [Myxococcales bacterium]